MGHACGILDNFELYIHAYLFLVITLSAYLDANCRFRHKKKMELDLNLTPHEEDMQQP
jgi:hypothetical protein